MFTRECKDYIIRASNRASTLGVSFRDSKHSKDDVTSIVSSWESVLTISELEEDDLGGHDNEDGWYEEEGTNTRQQAWLCGRPLMRLVSSNAWIDSFPESLLWVTSKCVFAALLIAHSTRTGEQSLWNRRATQLKSSVLP